MNKQWQFCSQYFVLFLSLCLSNFLCSRIARNSLYYSQNSFWSVFSLSPRSYTPEKTLIWSITCMFMFFLHEVTYVRQSATEYISKFFKIKFILGALYTGYLLLACKLASSFIQKKTPHFFLSQGKEQCPGVIPST